MATAKITKVAADKAAPGFLWDTEIKGFGLNTTAGGSRSYVFAYRLGGREAPKRRKVIGKHGSPWTPDEARTEAKRLARLVADGVDPMDADKERRRQAVDLAFKSYVGTFAKGHLAREWGPRWVEVERLLEREPVDVLGAKPLPKITRGDLSAVWDTLVDRPAVARLAFAAMRKLFRWAVGRGDLERSPMDGMTCPVSVPSRDRVLTDEELALVWHAAAVIGSPFSTFYRMLILTGQRREEVAALPWCELNRTEAEWRLPAERAKNGAAHIVPLAPQVVALLDGLAGGEKWPRKGYVFTTTGKTPISGFSRAKSRLDKEMSRLEAEAHGGADEEAEGIAAWRVHDLRRTLATGLG